MELSQGFCFTCYPVHVLVPVVGRNTKVLELMSVGQMLLSSLVVAAVRVSVVNVMLMKSSGDACR